MNRKMYNLIVLVEKIYNVFIRKCKLLFWKIKYGKRFVYGKNFKFRKRFNINIDKKGKLIIGDDNFFNNSCSINCRNEIRIGDKNIFGENVKIYDHNHVFNKRMLNRKVNFTLRKVTVGNNNWFGTNCVLLSKSEIGDNNVFATGETINSKIASDLILKNGNLTKINYADEVAGFFHDTRLKNDNNDYFSTGSYSYDIFTRYLKNFSKIIVSTRVENIGSDKTKLVQVNGKNIEVMPIKSYSEVPDYFFRKKQIKKEISERVSQVDFCIIRIPSIIGSLAYEECLKQQKKYVIEMVACPWDSYWNYGNIKGKLFAPIMYFKTKRICRNADNIIYVSNSFLQNRYPTNGNSVAISNVNLIKIDEETLEKRKKKIACFDKKNIIKIGLIGSLNVNFKGHYEAIRMADILKRNGYKIELHFLGNGSKERWLELVEKYSLSKEIVFEGTLPNGEPVLKWLDELDLYIVPSLQEGLPRALIEAMSRGCPSIGMKTGGIPELLNKDMICQRKDYKELAKKVEFLINNQDKMINEAIRNFNEAKKYLKSDLDKKREDFLSNIKEVLK